MVTELIQVVVLEAVLPENKIEQIKVKHKWLEIFILFL